MVIKNFHNIQVFSLRCLAFWIVLIFTQSCQNYDKTADLKRADSLRIIAYNAYDVLNVNQEAIRSRKDSIRYKLDFIKSKLPSKGSDELRSAMSRLEGIRVTYTEFSEKFPILEFDNQIYVKKVDKLRDDLLTDKIKEKDFKTRCDSLAEPLNKHLKSAETTVRSVREMENEYSRNIETIDILFHSLRDYEKAHGKPKPLQ